MDINFKYQKIKLRVSKIGQRIYFKSESINGFKYIKSIALHIGNENALFGSTFGFRVDEKEIFDESHEAHLLTYANDSAPNERKLLFEKPIAINGSKIEGIYTDCALQGLLDNISNNPNGGVISKNDINVIKTYVSGKDIMSFNVFAVDAGMLAYTGSIGLIPSPSPQIYYPYDVRIELLLTK